LLCNSWNGKLQTFFSKPEVCHSTFLRVFHLSFFYE
jgi:hypothetical protein